MITAPRSRQSTTPPFRLLGLLPFAFVTAGFHNALNARQDSVILRGTVYSADLLRPVPAARVSIDDGAQLARSDLNDHFLIGPIAPGAHFISFDRTGFVARTFRIAVSDTSTGTLDIGPIPLVPQNAPPVRVQGIVADARTSNRIPRAVIALNGAIVATTDDAGHFDMDEVSKGNNLIEVRRIGYTPLMADLEVDGTARDVNITLVLHALPVVLDDVEVVVEGDKTIYATGRMRGFYRRRRSTPGTFITREEIERRNPLVMSDMLRTIPGVRITQSGLNRRITVRGCSPVIYLDGMPLRGIPLDNVVFPEHVLAIEVHRGAFLPVEFMTFGSCATIAIWTR